LINYIPLNTIIVFIILTISTIISLIILLFYIYIHHTYALRQNRLKT